MPPLHLQTAARVWDAFLCEGAKVLLRVAIALVKARAVLFTASVACYTALTQLHNR